jgi:[ribosomal protein S5]-alanine N-acetyltransferase
VLGYKDTQQMVQKMLRQYSEYGYCFWKVLLKPKDQFVGIAGLLHQEINNKPETEISYRILEEHWKKGYATEAAKACKQYAETKLKQKRLISLIHPQNDASIRVATKLGAKRTRSVICMRWPKIILDRFAIDVYTSDIPKEWPHAYQNSEMGK